MSVVSVACAVAITAQIVPVQAQSTEAHPKFDAASVKLDTRGIRVGVNVAIQGGPGTSNPGFFNISYGQPMKLLISKAYEVAPDQIFGPAWLDDVPANLYTITARLPPDTTREQFLLMWQDLLAERFHITLHHETRNFPGYDLVVASPLRIKQWTPDQTATQAPVAANPGTDEQGFPRLRPNQQAGMNLVRHEGGASMTILETHHQSMSDFAKGLGQTLKQAGVTESNEPLARIADKTGLSGSWEFKFQYEGSMLASAPGAGGLNTDGPSIFTVIEKQLGLKLVKSKGTPVEVLVIDHIEKIPTEN
jgi:uncharacterized protein (TIGR03435 family)